MTKLKLTHDSFLKWGVKQPHIAVAGLNLHAGEGGPFPADSVFNRAINGEFDVVLALYHDQGHISIKVYGFEKSVSIALGLPFIRTSVDHGTAFDIAGKGIANPESFTEAIKTAVKLIGKNR